MRLDCISYHNLRVTFYTSTQEMHGGIQSCRVVFFSANFPSLPTINLIRDICKGVVSLQSVVSIIEVPDSAINIFARTRCSYKVVISVVVSDRPDLWCIHRVIRSNLLFFKAIVLVKVRIARLDAVRAGKRIYTTNLSWVCRSSHKQHAEREEKNKVTTFPGARSHKQPWLRFVLWKEGIIMTESLCRNFDVNYFHLSLSAWSYYTDWICFGSSLKWKSTHHLQVPIKKKNDWDIAACKYLIVANEVSTNKQLLQAFAGNITFADLYNVLLISLCMFLFG